MSRDNEKSTKGKIIKLKLDQEFESKGGKEYTAHVLVIEDGEGDSHKFTVNTKIKAAEFVAKLKVGDKVSVKTGGEYNSVQAVFKEGFEKKEFKGGSRGGFKSDPTGAIQGMVLKAAIDIAISSELNDNKDLTLEERIIKASKIVLLAKLKIDKLVIQALKPKDDEDNDDADEDRETPAKKTRQQDDEDSDEPQNDEESSKKSKKKSSPY